MGLYGDDPTTLEDVTVELKDLSTGQCLLPCREADKADNAGVRYAMDDGQLPEVLVERHQDAAVPVRDRQDFRVPGVLRPAARPLDIMPGSGERRRCATPYARVEKDLHGWGGKPNGSIRSCATSRRA